MKESVTHSQRMPKPLYEKAAKAANKDKRSLTQFINFAVEEKLNREK